MQTDAASPSPAGTTLALPGRRIESWKEIAAYLGRGVTTVQRWELSEGLPVHRLAHTKKGSVFAFTGELDAWREARTLSGSIPETDPERAAAGYASDPGRGALSYIRGRLAFGLLACCAVIAIMIAFGNRPSGRVASSSLLPQGVRPTLQARPIANTIDLEDAPSLSPDGTHVVYAVHTAATNPQHHLMVRSLDTGTVRPLATTSAGQYRYLGYSSWSPRGDTIAFLDREGTDTWGLYLVSSTGGPARRLTGMAGIGIAWAPDGKSVAFADRGSTGEPFSMFAISLETRHRRQLTFPPPGSFGDTHAAFSPDGRQLAIARYGTLHEPALYVAPSDGTNGSLEWLGTFAGLHGVAWTPDAGAIIAGTHVGLWKVALTAPHTKTLLVPPPGSIRQISISRASAGRPARLVYEVESRDMALWRGDRTALPLKAELFPGSTWWEDFPAFSPDGQRVAFVSNRTGYNEVWVAQADGTSPTQVTFRNQSGTSGTSWSPDGTRLAFAATVGQNRDIFTIEVDGSRSTRLTTDASQEDTPSWSRDGRWIYFRSDRGGLNQVWKIAAAGGTPIRVTSGEGTQALESSDGKRLYFVRAMRTPGLWSMPVGGGPESPVIADVHEGYWGVTDEGIAFIVSSREKAPGGPELRFFEFSTGKVSLLAGLPGALAPGFAVTRDGQQVLWTGAAAPTQADIMSLDGW